MEDDPPAQQEVVESAQEETFPPANEQPWKNELDEHVEPSKVLLMRKDPVLAEEGV